MYVIVDTQPHSMSIVQQTINILLGARGGNERTAGDTISDPANILKVYLINIARNVYLFNIVRNVHLVNIVRNCQPCVSFIL